MEKFLFLEGARGIPSCLQYLLLILLKLGIIVKYMILKHSILSVSYFCRRFLLT